MWNYLTNSFLYPAQVLIVSLFTIFFFLVRSFPRILKLLFSLFSSQCLWYQKCGFSHQAILHFSADTNSLSFKLTPFWYCHAKSCQSGPTLHDPMGCSLPGSTVLGILQAKILEWVAIPFSGGSSQPRDQTHISKSPALAGGFFITSATQEAQFWYYGLDSKTSAYNAGDLGSIAESGRSPGEGNGNPLQYSYLENPMDGGGYCP